MSGAKGLDVKRSDSTHLPGTVIRASGTLDGAWWASNGPTGGYLTRLALEIACSTTATENVPARSVDLHVLRLARPGPFEILVETVGQVVPGALVMMTFLQEETFALALVSFSPERGSNDGGDETPPAAYPPHAYAELSKDETTLPPVTAQFRYRPTTNIDGSELRPGWDAVWIEPLHISPIARASAAGAIDCWYPPNSMRSVREFLRGSSELRDPPPTNLLGVQTLFPARDAAYESMSWVLLANRLTTSVDGHYFEHSEIWSETGDLLVSSQLLRCNELRTASSQEAASDRS